jgi:hypothetical protein
MKHRIHLFDIVTSESHVNGVPLTNRLFQVVGLRVGVLEEHEGLWTLKDVKTGEETSCLGKFMTVWRPDDQNSFDP